MHELDLLAESHRREPNGTLDTTARGTTDYVTGALKVQRAMHHLDESLPGGQLQRTQAAFKLLEAGVAELEAWLKERGALPAHALPRGSSHVQEGSERGADLRRARWDDAVALANASRMVAPHGYWVHVSGREWPEAQYEAPGWWHRLVRRAAGFTYDPAD